MKRNVLPVLCICLMISSAAAAEQAFEVVELPTSLSLAQVDPVADPAPPVTQTPANPPTEIGDPYIGGRGMVTAQGMSGMFLNPTSGTLQQGQFTLQWCFLNQDDLLLTDGTRTGVDVLANGLMGAYGITDWLEVGVFSLWAHVEPSPFRASGGDETLNVLGPFVRVRILKDEGWMPELSVGGIFLDGDSSSDVIGRQEIFAAASKLFPIDEDGFLRSFRLHLGVRQIWKHERPSGLMIPANGTVGYIGGEIELPYDIYLVAEVATKDDIQGPRTPFSAGLQWKPNNVVGISIAGVNPGDAKRISFWFGVGLNFNF